MMPSPQPPSGYPNLNGVDVIGIFRRLAAGATLDDLLKESPGLKLDELRSCFAYAAEVLGNSVPLPAKIETIEWAEPHAAEPAALPPPSVVDDAITLAPTADTMPSTAAKRISLPGYEILGKLGEGGMGVVYKARHLRLNRLVAIKMILAGEHASEAMLARFAVEAEAVAQLQHPGIVQIHEIGEHDGHSFLALEYVAGGSLAARLDDKPWPAVQAAALVESLARTMQVAHDNGIVHRDLKPENVLLAEIASETEGKVTPKITDFGLAKRLQDVAGRTRTGEIMGTPSYMAPEQAAGKKGIGPTADIYSFGAILYRLLTGRPPFQADTALDTIMLVLEQEPTSLRTFNKKLPRDLETIALKCLAKEPAKRYASAADLADDLRQFLDGEPIKARRISLWRRLDRWCRKRPGAALARGVLVLLALALLISIGFADKMKALASLGSVVGGAFLFTAITRTPLRRLLISLSITLVLAIALAIYLTVHILWLKLPTTINSYTFKILFPGFNAANLAILVFLLPLLIGLLGGLFSNWGWRILSYCLVPLFLIAALQWTEVNAYVAAGLLVSLYFGFVCRFMRWHCDSNILDALVGALWGTGIGFVIGTMIFVMADLAMIPNGPVQSNSWTNVADVIRILLWTTGGIGGSILGAYLGAASGKKIVRR